MNTCIRYYVDPHKLASGVSVDELEKKNFEIIDAGALVRREMKALSRKTFIEPRQL